VVVAGVQLGKPDDLLSVEATKARIANEIAPRVSSYIREAKQNAHAVMQPLKAQATAMAERHRAERDKQEEGQKQRWQAEIRIGGEEAYFAPKADYIAMPSQHRFIGTETSTATEGWYSVLLHELTHWSGHENRLARQYGERFCAVGQPGQSPSGTGNTGAPMKWVRMERAAC
jgi:hypothetical protein